LRAVSYPTCGLSHRRTILKRPHPMPASTLQRL
jgi:hypothetical protein